MTKKYYLLLACLLGAQTAWAKPLHPKILFTWLAIGSTLVVVALWLMLWSRRKRD